MSCPHGYPNAHACRKCRSNKSEYRPLYKDVIKRWSEEQREEWEERSALVADGCKVSREESERLAWEIVSEQWAKKEPR